MNSDILLSGNRD